METIRIINKRKINLNLGKRIIYTKTKSNINKYRYKRKISKQKYISKTFLAILVFFLLLFIILIITRKSFSKSLKQTVEFIYNLFKKDIYSFKKSETYDEKGVKIYSLTGTLSFKRLDEAFYRKKLILHNLIIFM